MAAVILSPVIPDAEPPLSFEKKKAGRRILRWLQWLKKCACDRAEYVTQRQPAFFVKRVVGKEGRNKFRKDVQAFLRYYTTEEGKRALHEQEQAEPNQDRWGEIKTYMLLEPSWLPIEVRDKEGHLQAAALVSLHESHPYAPAHVRIEQLATAPHNLGKRTGAGTAVVEDAAWLTLRRRDHALTLMSLPSSVEFYEKLGMRLDFVNHAELLRAEIPKWLQERGGRAIPQPRSER
jgi:hypothetical protein